MDLKSYSQISNLEEYSILTNGGQATTSSGTIAANNSSQADTFQLELNKPYVPLALFARLAVKPDSNSQGMQFVNGQVRISPMPSGFSYQSTEVLNVSGIPTINLLTNGSYYCKQNDVTYFPFSELDMRVGWEIEFSVGWTQMLLDTALSIGDAVKTTLYYTITYAIKNK